LFSRFFVQALPCTAEGTVCRVRDTRSLVPRAYGTNRSSSNTSCSVQTYGYVACLAACFYLTYRIAINWAKLRPRKVAMSELKASEPKASQPAVA
jgi:hypothetical protein